MTGDSTVADLIREATREICKATRSGEIAPCDYDPQPRACGGCDAIRPVISNFVVALGRQ